MILLNNIINSLPNIVLWKDQDFIYRGCNDYAAEVLGLPHRNDIIGKTDHDLSWDKTYVEQFLPRDQRVIHTGQSQLRLPEVMTTPHITAEVLTDRVALHDETGKIAGLLVTSIKSDHINLADQTFFAHILENLPYCIFWKNQDCIYLGSNRNFANLVGHESPNDLIGKTDFDLNWGKGEAEFYTEADKKVMRGAKQVNKEELLKRPDGSEIVMLVSKTPVKDQEGTVIGVLGISTDITAMKKAERELVVAKEEAEAANVAKTAFIQNMSHDIRTPFTGILEMAKYILMHEDSEKKRTELGYIVESSERLLNLLNEIVDLAETKAGKHPIKFKSIDLKSLLEGLASMMTTAVKGKQLELSIKYPENIPMHVICDSFRVHRIVLNLLSNAIKFTEKGHVSVELNLLERNGDDLVLELIVADTGIGIPKDKQRFIFEKFGRLSSSYEGVYKGSGLGLSIVKQFVEEISGEIRVESKLKKGSRFICILPMQVAPA